MTFKVNNNSWLVTRAVVIPTNTVRISFCGGFGNFGNWNNYGNFNSNNNMWWTPQKNNGGFWSPSKNNGGFWSPSINNGCFWRPSTNNGNWRPNISSWNPWNPVVNRGGGFIPNTDSGWDFWVPNKGGGGFGPSRNNGRGFYYNDGYGTGGGFSRNNGWGSLYGDNDYSYGYGGGYCPQNNGWGSYPYNYNNENSGYYRNPFASSNNYGNNIGQATGMFFQLLAGNATLSQPNVVRVYAVEEGIPIKRSRRTKRNNKNFGDLTIRPKRKKSHFKPNKNDST